MSAKWPNIRVGVKHIGVEQYQAYAETRMPCREDITETFTARTESAAKQGAKFLVDTRARGHKENHGC